MELSRTAVTRMVMAALGILIVLALVFLGLKLHQRSVQRRALETLKAANPVEYFILHTAPAKSADDTRNAMVGTWEIAGVRNRQAGLFILVPPRSGNFKTWTLTNWSIVSYDFFSNVQYTASGHYTLQGDLYTESIEAATGQMTQYLGAHPSFRIRLEGDTYYQMSAGKNANPLEEMWRRVE